MGTNNFKRDNFFDSFFVFNEEIQNISDFHEIENEIDQMNKNMRYIQCEIKNGYYEGFELIFYNCGDFNMTHRCLIDCIKKDDISSRWIVTSEIWNMTENDIDEIKSITKILKSDYDLIFKKIVEWYENGLVDVGEQKAWLSPKKFTEKEIIQMVNMEKKNVESAINDLDEQLETYLKAFKCKADKTLSEIKDLKQKLINKSDKSNSQGQGGQR